MSKLTLKIGALHFAHAYVFASQEETRYYLNGVFIEPCPDGGVLAVTTDGHRLFVARDEAGSIAAPTILRLPAKFMASCKAKVPNNRGRLFLTSEEAMSGSPLIRLGGEDAPMSEGAVRGDVIDGTFPEWRRVVPKSAAPKYEPASFNAKYLADFKAAAAWANGSTSAPIKIMACGDDPAMVYPGGSLASWFGVLMPMRRNDEPKLPSWAGIDLDRPEPKKAARARQKVPALAREEGASS